MNSILFLIKEISFIIQIIYDYCFCDKLQNLSVVCIQYFGKMLFIFCTTGFFVFESVLFPLLRASNRVN